jgi:hypothetical protein
VSGRLGDQLLHQEHFQKVQINGAKPGSIDFLGKHLIQGWRGLLLGLWRGCFTKRWPALGDGGAGGMVL